MPNNKVRFVALVSGKEKQIFSVRQQPSDCSLLIGLKAQKCNFGRPDFQEVQEQHISVHSRRDERNKITFVTTYKSKEQYKRSIIVKGSRRKPFLFPVINMLDGNLGHESRDLKGAENDIYRRLVGFLSGKFSLNYTIYASDPDVYLPNVQGFSLNTHKFDEFNISIYSTFLHMSGSPTSIIDSHVRGALMRNSELLEDNLHENVPPMTTYGIEKYLYRQHFNLGGMYFKSIGPQALHPETPYSLKDGSPTHFLRWPLESDNEHYLYGENSRDINQIYAAPNFVDGTPKPPGFSQRYVPARPFLNPSRRPYK